MRIETKTYRVAFGPRWWQLRSRYQWWKHRRHSQRIDRETGGALSEMRREIDRAFLFGERD